MEIHFISDYVCPYCLVAKEALKKALEHTGVNASVTWHPFELTEEPKEQVDTWHDEVRRSHYQILKEPCRQLGLAMKLPPHVVPRPYTRLAFEGFFEAQAQGLGERYNDLVYRAYFIDEKDIGQIHVLCEIAEKAGLDPAAFRQALEAHTWSDKEKQAVRTAREEWKVTHVPTIYIDGQEAALEDYTVSAFEKLLKKHTAPDSLTTDQEESLGMSCSIDGHCGPAV